MTADSHHEGLEEREATGLSRRRTHRPSVGCRFLPEGRHSFVPQRTTRRQPWNHSSGSSEVSQLTCLDFASRLPSFVPLHVLRGAIHDDSVTTKDSKSTKLRDSADGGLPVNLLDCRFLPEGRHSFVPQRTTRRQPWNHSSGSSEVSQLTCLDFASRLPSFVPLHVLRGAIHDDSVTTKDSKSTKLRDSADGGLPVNLLDCRFLPEGRHSFVPQRTTRRQPWNH